MTATQKAIQVANIAAAAAADKLAENLIALDVTDPMPLTDIFLLASGRNERQVASIADEIEFKLLEAGVKYLRREGKETGRWIRFGFWRCCLPHHARRRPHVLLSRATLERLPGGKTGCSFSRLVCCKL